MSESHKADMVSADVHLESDKDSDDNMLLNILYRFERKLAGHESADGPNSITAKHCASENIWLEVDGTPSWAHTPPMHCSPSQQSDVVVQASASAVHDISEGEA